MVGLNCITLGNILEITVSAYFYFVYIIPVGISVRNEKWSNGYRVSAVTLNHICWHMIIT